MIVLLGVRNLGKKLLIIFIIGGFKPERIEKKS
jgi:hypothetical protein